MSASSLPKFVAFDDLPAFVANERRAGRRTIVHCHGRFEMFGPEDVAVLRAAREMGDLLVVTVTADALLPAGKPSQDDRLRRVSALEAVDAVALSAHPTAIEAIRALRPDVYVKGLEFEVAAQDPDRAIFAERVEVERCGGKAVFTDGGAYRPAVMVQSREFSSAALEFVADLRGRIAWDRIVEALDAARGLKVLVVGEGIVDRYVYVRPLDRASKDARIAYHETGEEERFAGGAIACANNLAAFCGEVRVLTAVGDADDGAMFFAGKLAEGVSFETVRRPGRTLAKTRSVVKDTFEKVHNQYSGDIDPMPGALDEAFRAKLAEACAAADLVVVLDYGHGLLSPASVAWLPGCGRFLALNVQTNGGNRGFNLITKYTGAAYASLDLAELQIATADRVAEPDQLVPELRRRLASDYLAVTLGRLGCLMAGPPPDLRVGHVPSVLSPTAKDRMGAGDAFLAATAPFLRVGLDPGLVGLIGNVVGAEAVETVGHRTHASRERLVQLLKSLFG